MGDSEEEEKKCSKLRWQLWYTALHELLTETKQLFRHVDHVKPPSLPPSLSLSLFSPFFLPLSVTSSPSQYDYQVSKEKREEKKEKKKKYWPKQVIQVILHGSQSQLNWAWAQVFFLLSHDATHLALFSLFTLTFCPSIWFSLAFSFSSLFCIYFTFIINHFVSSYGEFNETFTPQITYSLEG